MPIGQISQENKINYLSLISVPEIPCVIARSALWQTVAIQKFRRLILDCFVILPRNDMLHIYKLPVPNFLLRIPVDPANPV